MVTNLIMNGNNMKNNLKVIDKNKKWLLNEFEKRTIKVEDVFLLTCNNKEEIMIYEKDYYVGNGVSE